MLIPDFLGTGYRLLKTGFKLVTIFIGYPVPLQYYSSLWQSAWYLSLMRQGRFSITSLNQANNPCSTIQASVPICLWWYLAIYSIIPLD